MSNPGRPPYECRAVEKMRPDGTVDYLYELAPPIISKPITDKWADPRIESNSPSTPDKVIADILAAVASRSSVDPTPIAAPEEE